MKENTYPQFISNKPYGEDLFDGKSHENIAINIGEQIQKSDENTRLIGIDGGWGSGKSNVIAILENKLKDSHHVYIYDAWGHQEDLQRKSFLEELTNNLITEELLNKKTHHIDLTGEKHNCTWRDKLTFLLSRKKVINHKKVPKLSASILWFGAIFILTPIMTIIANYLGDAEQKILGTIYIKLGFALFFPIMGIICFLIYSCVKRWTTGKWGNLAELFYVYKAKELSFSTFETLSENEPSVFEFKQWMHDLSADLSKCLIIVFDNMDRLPPEKIKELWSSIHTFFAEGDIYKNIWVILPFDREHLRESFNSNDEQEADQFINKTFSIIYKISPPILTDWKNFFRKMFEQAFGTAEKPQESIVISLFDILKIKFTPRDIIAFINELVSLKHIWKESITLKYLTLYILTKDKILSDPRKEILSGDYFIAVKKYFSDTDELQKNIAALTFNVSLDKAYQVILHRELELALRDHNTMSLNDLAKHSHFIDVLEDVTGKSEFDLKIAVQALSKLDSTIINDEGKMNRLQSVWDDLSGRQVEIQIEEQKFTDTHHQLLSNCSTNSQVEFIKNFCQQVSSFPGQVDEEFDGSKYYLALADMQKSIDENSISLIIEDYLSEKQVLPHIFINYLRYAQGDYEQYKLYSDSSKLDEFCANAIPENFVDPDCLLLLNTGNRYSFNLTAKKLTTLITEDGVNESNYTEVLETQKAIIKKRKQLSALLNHQQLYTLLTTVKEESEGYFDLIALRLTYGAEFQTFLLQLTKTTGVQQPDPTLSKLSQTDEDMVEGIAQRIEFYSNYGNLLKLITTWSQPLLNAVVGALTKSSYGTSRLSILLVLESYDTIKAALNLDGEIILQRFDAWDHKELTAEKFKETVSISLLNDSLDVNNDLTKHIIILAKEFIDKHEEDNLITDWDNDSNYYYSILYSLMLSGKKKSLPNEVFKAIKGILSEIAKNQKTIPDADSKWHYFIEKADKKDIQPTIKNIRDNFLTDTEITAESFLFFASFLEKYGDLQSRSGDFVRRVLTTVIMDNDGLKYIASNREFYAKIIINANDDASDFKDSLNEKFQNDPENIELSALATQVGLILNNLVDE